MKKKKYTRACHAHLVIDEGKGGPIAWQFNHGYSQGRRRDSVDENTRLAVKQLDADVSNVLKVESGDYLYRGVCWFFGVAFSNAAA